MKMKRTKRFLTLFIALITVLNSSALVSIQSSAHASSLNIGYDVCEASEVSDSINEAWYVLNSDTYSTHYSDNETTIKYYFSDTSIDGQYTWETDVSSAVANDIKNAYANSMKKWNNVYFYIYNSSGNVEKKKLINIVEGTQADHNITIYPTSDTSYYGLTYPTGEYENVDTNNSTGVSHRHYSNWIMQVYVHYYYVHDSVTSTDVNCVRARNGAHEFGHVLGLYDVDSCCNANTTTNHHHELLMGYGSPLSNRSPNITYKDIAGVAITRGFHTDNDHKWLNCDIQSDGTYKLICSICNGVKYVSSLSGYSYNEYLACDNNHSLSSGNMMAVASYGTKDYYKCKYCRYVAPFSSIVSQNYTITYTDTTHTYTNNVQGLNYSFQEAHSMTSNGCYTCGYGHTHSYGAYVYSNNRLHIRYCVCGSGETQAHYVKQSDIIDNRYVTCLGCNTLLDLNEDMANIDPNSVSRVTINGSYILSNGIIVLVDADVDAYINGTLQFYDINSVPEVE